jgi:putative FmdB family regulatory protein
MPTYEYECPKCPRVFEVRQRITEPALETCDRCGGPIHRLLSAAPFILKGEGWYVTDYPSDARKKATSAESAGSKETTPKESSTAKDGGSAESKPAASSESKSSTDGSTASASSSSKAAGGTSTGS